MFKGATPVAAWTPNGATRLDSPAPAVQVPPIDVDPSAGMTALEKLAVGAGAATDRAIRGVGDLFTDVAGRITGDDMRPKGQPDQGAADAALYQKYHPGGWATAGEIGADVAMSALPVAKASTVGGRVLSRTLGRAAAPVADVAANAGYAAATAPEDRGTAALWGGGGALAGRAAASLLRGPLSSAVTPEARAMMNEGVSLTPGQAMGKDSILNRMEQSVASNPLTLGSVANARRRGVQEANINSINSVVKQVGGRPISSSTSISEAMSEAYEAVGQAYQRALEGATYPNATNALAVFNKKTLDGVFNDFPLLTPKHQGELLHYVGALDRRLPPEDVSGTVLKQIDSELGYMARQLEKSLDPRDKIAAPAWRDVQREWRDKVLGYAQDDLAKQKLLDTANKAYRELLTLEKAKGAQDFIAPRRLTQTLENMKLSKTEPLSVQARNMAATLPNTMPDTGTAERLMANALPSTLMGGGYLTQQQLGDPWGLGTAALVAGAATSRPGSRYLTGGVGAVTPQMLKDAGGWVRNRTLVDVYRRLPPKVQEQIAAMAPDKAGEALSAMAAQMGRASATTQHR